MLSGRKPSPWFTAPSSEKYRALRSDPILCNWYIEPCSLCIYLKEGGRQGTQLCLGAGVR
jgi:hypothetical protein